MRDHIERSTEQDSYHAVETIRAVAAMMRAEKVLLRDVFAEPHRVDSAVYLLEIDGLKYAFWFLSNVPYLRRVGSVWGPMLGFHLLTRAGDDLTIGKVGFNRQIVKAGTGLGPPSLLRCDRASSKIGGKYSNSSLKNSVRLTCDPNKWGQVKKFALAEFRGAWSAAYAIVLNEFGSRIYWIEVAAEKSIDTALLSSADACGIFI